MRTTGRLWGEWTFTSQSRTDWQLVRARVMMLTSCSCTYYHRCVVGGCCYWCATFCNQVSILQWGSRKGGRLLFDVRRSGRRTPRACGAGRPPPAPAAAPRRARGPRPVVVRRVRWVMHGTHKWEHMGLVRNGPSEKHVSSNQPGGASPGGPTTVTKQTCKAFTCAARRARSSAPPSCSIAPRCCSIYRQKRNPQQRVRTQ